jgi:hypothetical protein
MSGTQGASLEEAYSKGRFIYIPMTKHFAITRSSSCAMPRPRHCVFVSRRPAALLPVRRWKLEDVLRYGWSSLESGMMISRRPKRRASSENAPGPSSASAKQMIARFRWAMELAGVEVWIDGNSAQFMITFPTAANPQQIGVRNPTKIEMPVISARPPRHQQEAVSCSCKNKTTIPSAAAFSATTNLRRRRPPPGNPPGNAENSLCSGHLPYRRDHGNSNVVEEGKNVMPRKRHFARQSDAADRSGLKDG